MSGVLQSALEYASRTWPVFPLHGIVNGRCTCGRTDCSSPGKHPLVRRGLYEASTDPHVIEEWWRRWRRANIGLVTGMESGLVVIDIDLPAAHASIHRLVHRVQLTLTALTGGGGLHLLLRAPEDHVLHNHASRLPGILGELPGIDLRGQRGYIVAPPSAHRSGNAYTWLDPDREVAPAPEWLREPERTYTPVTPIRPANFEGDGSPYGLAVLHAEMALLSSAPIGTRNHELNRCVFTLARLVAGGELLEHAARKAALTKGVAVGLKEWECRQTIDSAFDAGLMRPRCAPHRLRT